MHIEFRNISQSRSVRLCYWRFEFFSITSLVSAGLEVKAIVLKENIPSFENLEGPLTIQISKDEYLTNIPLIKYEESRSDH